jgi:hypothetical protein
MNSKYTRASLLCCFAALFLAMVVYAQGGFTGPSQTSSNHVKVTGKGQIQATAANSITLQSSSSVVRSSSGNGVSPIMLSSVPGAVFRVIAMGDGALLIEAN